MPRWDDESKDWVNVPEVQARLTYRADGEPIAVAVSPKGAAGSDLLQDWLRAMFLRVKGDEEAA